MPATSSVISVPKAPPESVLKRWTALGRHFLTSRATLLVPAPTKRLGSSRRREASLSASVKDSRHPPSRTYPHARQPPPVHLQVTEPRHGPRIGPRHPTTSR